ncbi:hypothetical protein SAMN04489722_11130 [Algibacter lectus]|uniref:hypothetical protein n=1 Tax=Algibacter lectus TaxID=221126 RepID=UPI0008F05D50|nr:hypothetical protein [Algibacter lectus]SFD51383.1 hypothetical protein SAMN04489722_11130 [Algibacter lectus]
MKEISILDCENYESMLSSLASIFTTSGNDILSFLKSTDLNEIWKKSLKEKYANEYLFDEFLNEFKINESKIIKAYWFHNTRVLKGSEFKEGILPLSIAINKIETLINEIIKKIQIPINNNSLLGCSVIQNKLNSKTNQGPWAFLIRDFAFEKADGIHDYLKSPELIEDIIYFKYPEKYDLIFREFQNTTVKCIIKFKTEKEFHPQRLLYVINYLYNKINDKKMDWRSNANFSNNGKIISPEMILKIDYL